MTADQQFSFSIFHDSCGQLATLSCILIESRSQARHWSCSQLLGFEEFLHLCGRPRISCENKNQNKYLRKQVFNKKDINRSEFKEAVEKVTSLKVRQELVFFKELEQLGKVSERESEFLFLMMDTDGDGLLHTERELKVRREKKNIGSMYDVWVVFSDSTPTWCFSAERVIEKEASQGVQL